MDYLGELIGCIYRVQRRIARVRRPFCIPAGQMGELGDLKCTPLQQKTAVLHSKGFEVHAGSDLDGARRSAWEHGFVPLGEASRSPG